MDKNGGVWKTLKNGHRVYIVDGQIYGSPEQYLIKTGQTRLVRNEGGTVSRVFPEKEDLTKKSPRDIIYGKGDIPPGFQYRKLNLSQKEYAQLISALNTHYAAIRNDSYPEFTLGKYSYLLENHGYDDYNVYACYDWTAEDEKGW